MRTLILFAIAGLVGAANAQIARNNLGDTIYLSAGDTVPSIPEGTLWSITGTVSNSTSINPMTGASSGDILVAQVVKMTRDQAGANFNQAKIGGFLPGSDSFIVLKIRLAAGGDMAVQLNYVYTALVNEKYSVGMSVTVREGDKLPDLRVGYSWQEQMRIDGMTSLMPNIPGFEMPPPRDSIQYTLVKTDASLPDSFEVPRIESVIAPNESVAQELLAKRAKFSNFDQRAARASKAERGAGERVDVKDVIEKSERK